MTPEEIAQAFNTRQRAMWQGITRFEVIDEDGRVYTRWDCQVEPSWHDSGRTLKVFIKKHPAAVQGKS